MSSNAYLDQKLSPEQRADVLLKDMTLNEKMAQVNCVFPYGGVEYDFDWIADHIVPVPRIRRACVLILTWL